MYEMELEEGVVVASARGQSAVRVAVDLDKLIQDFNSWQEVTGEVLQGNKELSNQLRGTRKECSLHQQAAAAAKDDVAQLRSTVESLHRILVKRCDMEEENTRLKEQIAGMQTSAEQLEEEHRKQMTEAVENLQAVHEAHRKEIIHLQDTANQQRRQEAESLQKTIQEQSVETRQLQKQLADLEKDKHTEMVKLRLEYDAKLLKLQKQTSKAQSGQPCSSANHEIFRKKLQHARAQSDREIASLKQHISELERQLSLANKKRRL